MIVTKINNPVKRPVINNKDRLVNILFEHIDKYREPNEGIEKAISFTLKELKAFGGLTLFVKQFISSILLYGKTGFLNRYQEERHKILQN